MHICLPRFVNEPSSVGRVPLISRWFNPSHSSLSMQQIGDEYTVVLYNAHTTKQEGGLTKLWHLAHLGRNHTSDIVGTEIHFHWHVMIINGQQARVSHKVTQAQNKQTTNKDVLKLARPPSSVGRLPDSPFSLMLIDSKIVMQSVNEQWIVRIQ